jgi:hypothetical protein
MSADAPNRSANHRSSASAGIAEAGEHIESALDIAHQRLLSDLEQIAGGEVDGDRDRAADLAPAQLLAERLVEHVHRQGPHQPVLLGERDEQIGHEQPAAGCCYRTSASTSSSLPSTRAIFGW